jgi:hypothetical protein
MLDPQQIPQPDDRGDVAAHADDALERRRTAGDEMDGRQRQDLANLSPRQGLEPLADGEDHELDGGRVDFDQFRLAAAAAFQDLASGS